MSFSGQEAHPLPKAHISDSAVFSIKSHLYHQSALTTEDLLWVRTETDTVDNTPKCLLLFTLCVTTGSSRDMYMCVCMRLWVSGVCGQRSPPRRGVCVFQVQLLNFSVSGSCSQRSPEVSFIRSHAGCCGAATAPELRKSDCLLKCG